MMREMLHLLYRKLVITGSYIRGREYELKEKKILL